MRNKQVEFNAYNYTLSKLSRFGYEIFLFLIHNRAVFRTAGSYVTERFHGRIDVKIFLMFIVAENTGSVNIVSWICPLSIFCGTSKAKYHIGNTLSIVYQALLMLASHELHRRQVLQNPISIYITHVYQPVLNQVETGEKRESNFTWVHCITLIFRKWLTTPNKKGGQGKPISEKMERRTACTIMEPAKPAIERKVLVGPLGAGRVKVGQIDQSYGL